MSTVQTEQVLVIPTALFHQCGHFQGFSSEIDKYLSRMLAPEVTQYLPRDQMEQDPSYKQLIPYCIFQHTDDAGNVSVFQYTRGKGQGESRLHSKRSIGIGGHISTLDIDATGTADPYQSGMQRELEEEVTISTPYTERCVGLINDDENEVGKVHLGVVHLFEVQLPEVSANESEIIESGFVPVQTLIAEIDQCETWSQICLNALFG